MTIPPPHEYVEVRSTAGLLDPDSLDERLRRAEHHAGLLEIGEPGRQSHCWLCRRHSEAREIGAGTASARTGTPATMNLPPTPQARSKRLPGAKA